MSKKHKILGFTLIEILFVIAIISVMASLGISVLQQRSQQLKVQKTALQMQQILQAGMAFKADSATSDWPVSGDTTFETKYLPVNSTYNPWGTAVYSYGPVTPDKKKFFVSTVTPSAKIATQIVALLPNAATQGDDLKTAYTEVSGINTGGGTASQITIAKVGNIILTNDDFDANGVITRTAKDNKTTVTFNCPAETKGDLFFSPYLISAGEAASAPTNIIKNLQFATEDCTPAQVKCRSIAVSFQAQYIKPPDTRTMMRATAADPALRDPGPPGLLSFKYVVYCTPNKL